MDPETRKELKQQQKREAILRSAARAFSQKGYFGTSLEDIADELLMTKGSLYYYFKDKEHILFECHDVSLDQVLGILNDIESSGESADVKLASLIEQHVGVMLDTLQGSAMALDFTALSKDLYDKVVSKRDQFELGMRKIIEEGVRDGIFAKVDTKLAVFAILGAINWIAKWFREGGRYGADEIGKFYGQLFVEGLKRGDVTTLASSSDALARSSA